MREIGRLFGVSRFTVHRCVRRVSSKMCQVLKKLIRWPDHSRQGEISSAVRARSNIENCIGFIDGI